MSAFICSVLLVIAANPIPPINLSTNAAARVIVGPSYGLHYIPPRLVRQSVAGTDLGDRMRAAWAECSKVVNAPFTQEEFDTAWSTFNVKYAALKAEWEQQQIVRQALDAGYRALATPLRQAPR